MDLVEAKNIVQSTKDRHPWELARVEVVYYLIKQIFPAISQNERRIFDIGCGDVFVTEQLSKLLPKARCIAVDTGITDSDLVLLRQKFHHTSIRVYKSLDEAFATNPEPVDIVLLLDVI